jgi:hypothetical protein
MDIKVVRSVEVGTLVVNSLNTGWVVEHVVVDLISCNRSRIVWLDK